MSRGLDRRKWPKFSWALLLNWQVKRQVYHSLGSCGQPFAHGLLEEAKPVFLKPSLPNPTEAEPHLLFERFRSVPRPLELAYKRSYLVQ